MKTLLATLLFLSPVAMATEIESQEGYSKSRTCYRSEYREEYIPGTEDDPGFVRSFKETVEVPVEYDDNDCSEGTLIGGLLGGGLAGFGSRGKDRWWAISIALFFNYHLMKFTDFDDDFQEHDGNRETTIH